VLPCRPYTPQHRGKSNGGFATCAAMPSRRRLPRWARRNLFLADWKRTWPTPHSRHDAPAIGACFAEERPLYNRCGGTLPVLSGGAPQRASRQLCGSGKAYYETPPEYIGEPVWARWDGRTVRLLMRVEQIAMHTPPGAASSAGALGRPGGADRWSSLPLLDRPGVFVRRRLWKLGAPRLCATRPAGVAGDHGALPVECEAPRGRARSGLCAACAEGLWRYKTCAVCSSRRGAVQPRALRRGASLDPRPTKTTRSSSPNTLRHPPPPSANPPPTTTDLMNQTLKQHAHKTAPLGTAQ